MARRMGALRRDGQDLEVLSARGALVARCPGFDPAQENRFQDSGDQLAWRVVPEGDDWRIEDGRGTELGRIWRSGAEFVLESAEGSRTELQVRKGRRTGTWAELVADRAVARVRRSTTRRGTDRVTATGPTPDGRVVLTGVALLRFLPAGSSA